MQNGYSRLTVICDDSASIHSQQGRPRIGFLYSLSAATEGETTDKPRTGPVRHPYAGGCRKRRDKPPEEARHREPPSERPDASDPGRADGSAVRLHYRRANSGFESACDRHSARGRWYA